MTRLCRRCCLLGGSFGWGGPDHLIDGVPDPHARVLDKFETNQLVTLVRQASSDDRCTCECHGDGVSPRSASGRAWCSACLGDRARLAKSSLIEDASGRAKDERS
jgi:hypothetical protein